jgi:hypothetical protein
VFVIWLCGLVTHFRPFCHDRGWRAADFRAGGVSAFQSGIKERCLEPPQSGEATIVGDYRMLGD